LVLLFSWFAITEDTFTKKRHPELIVPDAASVDDERRVREETLRSGYTTYEILRRTRARWAQVSRSTDSEAMAPRASHKLRTPLNAFIGFTGTLLLRIPAPLNRGRGSTFARVMPER
jgi:signal transduction histidine kinase